MFKEADARSKSTESVRSGRGAYRRLNDTNVPESNCFDYAVPNALVLLIALSK
jgi:hypothetical protein